MNNVTQNIVEDFFKHLSQRNLKELTNLFSDKVDWLIPGDKSKAPWLGARHSKKEVSDFYELLWKNTEPLSVKVEKILMDEDTALITGEFSTRMLQTHKILDSLFFIHITIENNLIVRYRLLEDTLAVSISMAL